MDTIRILVRFMYCMCVLYNYIVNKNTLGVKGGVATIATKITDMEVLPRLMKSQYTGHGMEQ